MMLRTTRFGLAGLLMTGAFSLLSDLARAQEPPASDAGQPVQDEASVTTQPTLPKDSQEQLDRLLRLRDEMQRSQRERGEGDQSGGAPQVSRRSVRGARRQAVAQPATAPLPTAVSSAPTPQPPADAGAARPSSRLEELRRRAQASTQRAAGQDQPPVAEPRPAELPAAAEEFIGPPIELANTPPAATLPQQSPTEPATVRPPLGEAPEVTKVTEVPAAPPASPTRKRKPAADELSEWFNFKDMPWEDVIAHFVERIGKPLLTTDDLTIGGSLTYVSDRKFTKDQAIDELNLIMHEKGYRFVEEEHHIRIVPVGEMKAWVPISNTFDSVEAFEQAKPRDMDFVIVYYQVADRPAQAYVDMFLDALPEPTLISALPDSNQLKIVALARDVRRFLTLKDKVRFDPTDIRKLKIFDIKTNAMDIEQRVRSFLKIGGPGQMPMPRLVRDPRTGQMVPQPQPVPTPAVEADVLMVADERTNSIIVKATEDKIQEIETLIRTLDQKPDIGEFKTEIMKIKHADASQVATLLNEIFRQEQGQVQATIPNWQQQQMIQQQIQARLRRGAQPGQPPQPVPVQVQPGAAPESIIVEGVFERAKKTIRLVADPRMNALIVYANSEGMDRVRKMLEILDQPHSENFQTIALENAKVADMAPLLTQMVNGMAALPARGGRPAPTVIPDDMNNVFHILAERDDMDRIEQLIKQLDVAAPEHSRHVVELKNLRPSDVAQMVQTLLAGSGAGRSAVVTPPGIRQRVPAGPGVSPPRASGAVGEGYQVIALDSAGLLIVICSDEDWAKVEQTIQMWDERAVSNTPRLATFSVTKGSATAIASTLAGFYRTYQHPVLGSSPVAVQPEGDKIYVYAIQPAIEEIGALIESLDVESVIEPVVILPLANADAATVAQQAQALFTARAGQRGGAPAPLIQSEPLTNSLVVQADKADLERIKNFALQMDQRIGAQATEQRFFTMRYAQPDAVANAVQNIFGPGAGGPRGLAGRAQVRAIAAGSQVIVEAPKEKFAAIEAFIKQMDDPRGNEMIVKMVKLPGADVGTIANTLTGTIRSLVRPGTPQPIFTPEVSTESIIVSAPVDLWPKIDELVATFAEGAEDLTLERHLYRISIADATYVADLLQRQLPWQVQQKKGQNVAGRINISVDARQNQVIVNAPKFVHALAAELIKELDREDTTELAPVTIALKHADPVQVANTINQVFGAGRGVAGQSRQQEVQATVSNGLLVVKASKKRLEEVQKLIGEIDAEDEIGLQVKTYALKVLNATQVSLQVQAYLRSIGQQAQRAGRMQPGAFAEPTTNTLVVIAPAEQLPFIDGLIAKLESAERPESGARTYVLKNARADQVYQNIDMMLKAKVAEREGDVRKARVQTAVFSDAATNRLFVFAPEDYQALAAELIKLVDEEVAVGDIVHIIPLENADAQQVAQSLNQVVAGGRGAAGPGARGGSANVRITADVGSNSVVLAGLAKDVAEVEGWLKELDINSVRVPEMQIFRIQNVPTKRIVEAVKALYGTAKTPQDAVSVSADEYSGEVIVTANKRKMRQVEAVIKQLDAPPSPEEEGLLTGGRELHFVDVYRAKASDVVWDVRGLLRDEDEGGPSLEADWFDQYIIVKCRPSEFPHIEKLIREFDNRAKLETKVLVRKPRGDPERLLQYLQARGETENVLIERVGEGRRIERLVEDVWQEGEEPEVVKEKREKAEREKAQDKSGQSRRTIPFHTALPLAELLLDEPQPILTGQSDPAVRAALRPDNSPAQLTAFQDQQSNPTPVALQEPPERPRRADSDPRASDSAATQPVRQREKTRIVLQPDGSFIIQGPKDGVDDLQTAIDLLEEDLTVGEVIRIFRFKYGDVTAAAEILSMMFDIQPRQIVIQQPQQPQRPQAQPGRQGEEGRQQPPTIMEQLRSVVGGQQPGAGRRGAGTQRMRIATDPGHNYLIVKCDEADLPEIRKLLRELDIPPGEVQIKVIQLKNLSAEETAQNISDVLGISKAQQRRGARMPQPTRPGMPGQPAQQQLIEMLQQQLVSVPGVEGGAKVERVEIVPNSITNSLLVSAPPEVMSLIERVIDELESVEDRDVVGIYHYPLKKARADDIVPLLQEIFSAAATGGGGGPPTTARGLRPGAGGGSPAAMGPVTISGDPRTNTIIFTAQKKDVPIVEKHISMLDIEGPVADAEMYVCRYGDAEAIAQAVEAIFASGALGRVPGQQRGAAASDIRIVAEAATNTIIVWGPLDKRNLVFEKIEALDSLAHQGIREIAVRFADPEKLAGTLSEVFAGAGTQTGARPGGRRPRGTPTGAPGGPSVTSTGRIMILGDKAAKKLLVRAPDEVFRQIEDLVVTLDQPSSQMQLKRFQLKYADAEGVVESVKQAMTEYMALASKTQTPTDFDAFTAVPDTRTNSVMVVGSDQTFAFVQQILTAVDVETPKDQKKEFRIFMLEKADAATVAEAINGFATGGAGAGGAQRTGGSRRGAAGTLGGASGAARELNVFAVAEEATNSVMVFGRAEDIDTVEVAVIEKLEDSIAERVRIETIAVRNVPPSQIVSFISMFMGETRRTTAGQPGRARPPTEQAGPQIVPNDSAKTLVVRGTKRQIEEVRDLVLRFDDKDIAQQTIKVIEIPYGQDAARLASDLERIVNQNEQDLADRTGRQPRRVVIGADEFTNTIIAAGDPALFGQVQMIVDQLADIRSPQAVTTIIQLKNLSAQDAEQVINELQRKGTSGGRSSGAVRPAGTGASGRSPAIRPPSGTGQQPRTPSSSPPPVRQPSGGGRRQSGDGGRGALLPQTPEQPLMVKPVAWIQPYLASTPLAPVVGWLLGEQLFGGPTPEDEQPQAPTTEPAGDEEVAMQPATEPAPGISEGLTGVSGALRGEVVARAIDSQRIVVTGDASDVEFIERILMMMEQSARAAAIEVFPLRQAKATALQPIIDKAVKAWIDARTKTPGPQDRFSINAEARSNSLIVSASEPLMEEIRDLIERLDVAKAGEQTTVRTVVLSSIRAAEAVAILRPTVEKLNKMRDVPADSQASIEAVDRNNSVMIMGTPADIEEIQKWLEAIDVEITADQKKKSFVRADAILIQLKNAQAEDVAKVINDMIKAELEAGAVAGDRKGAGKPAVKTIKLHMPDGTELPELQLEYPIRLIPEKGTNSLIIFSTMENNEALKAIVGVFDTLPVGADTDVKAFALRHAAAEEVSKLIADIFKEDKYLARPVDGKTGGVPKGVLPPVPPGVAAKGLPYPLVVQHDARSNTVIVIGRKDAVLLAGGLISELDRPTMELGLKAHVLSLKSASANQLTEKLKKLLEERAKAVHGDKNAARDSAVLQPDERSNRLIVLATDEVYDMVEDLVLQLDAAEKYSVVDVRYRALERADAVKLKGMVEETFKSKKEAESKANKESVDTLSVLADARSNSLLLTGTRDYLDEAERLIAQLDRQFDPTVVFKARKIKLNSAPNVAALLKEMIEKALTQKDSKLSGTPIHVLADPVSDSLLMAAAREDMDVLERWVDILDRPSEVGRMTRIIPLARATAEDVSKAVGEIFKAKGGVQKGGEIDIAVTADKTTNSVVAFGPPALLTDVEDFVRRLDSTEAAKSTVVRIFRLEQASAQDAGELLSRILDLRGGAVGGTGGGASGSGRTEAAKQVMLVFQRQHPELGLETLRGVRQDIVVISDTRTNSLVVTAPADSMALMESLVAAVDVPPQDAKIRVFRLRNSDAEQMVKTLEKLFERRTTATGRAGAGEQAERVLTLGEGLGGEGGRQEIAFTTDVRTNSVIAAGTRGYLDLAEQTILELDTVPLTDRVTFVYAPRNIKAESLVPSLKEFSDAEQKRLQDIGKDVSVGAKQERQVVAIANKDANRAILSVDPRFQESVMDVVRQLDQPPPQVLIQVLIVEVTMSNALDLGVEFAFQDLQYAKAGVSDTTTFDYVAGTDIGAAGSGMGGFTFTITGADFNFLFRTLQTENNLQVLSRPQIVAQDNMKATLKIVDDVPYVTGSAVTTGGVTSVSVARSEVGITLEVTPQINPDGFVRLEIKQEVSDQTGSTVAVGQGLTAPVFFRRNAETTLTVKDGETVVLGGLITARTENREVKVPLVGDIPGLGLLFRNQNDNVKRTELLVVLTPHVVRTVEEFRELSIAERDTAKTFPDEIRGDPLMQGLRVIADTQPAVEPRAGKVPSRERSRLGEQDGEEYGPLRPALRAEPPTQADPDSYDVPLSWKSPGRR